MLTAYANNSDALAAACLLLLMCFCLLIIQRCAHPYVLCRPVILVGLFSRPTSVDLGMAVNQLNATAPHASVVWQSLFLENAGPGARVVQQQMHRTC
jgi:hypothetical protein